MKSLNEMSVHQAAGLNGIGLELAKNNEGNTHVC